MDKIGLGGAEGDGVRSCTGDSGRNVAGVDLVGNEVDSVATGSGVEADSALDVDRDGGGG